MDHHHIDSMVGQWRDRMTPMDTQMREAQLKDPWHHTLIESMRRMAHQYDAAMQLEDVPEETRRRVLSMVLLGSPDGLESLALHRANELYKEALMRVPPSPLYFGPITEKGDEHV